MRLSFAIIGLVLAGGIFFMYTKPAYDSIQETRTTVAQYDAALDKAAELQKLKQALLSRFNTFNSSDLDRLQKLLPDHVDNVRLILDLDNLAGRYGLALQNVDVSSSQAQSSKSQTATGAIGASSQKYDSLTLKFGTTATYTDFDRFLKDLETSLRIVDLVSLSITAVPADAGLGVHSSEPLYTFNISLRTYWLK